MISGHEPIRLLRQSSVILMLCAPSVGLAQDKPAAQQDAWTSTPAPPPPEKSADRAPSDVSDPNPKSAPGGDADETDSDFAEETAMHWPDENNWHGAGWDDYESDGTPAHRDVRDDDEPRSDRRVRAPNYALWVGGGLGWTLPFGSLWGSCTAVDTYGQCVIVDGVPTHDFVAQGPSVEFDVGARLSHNYNVYALWERSWLGAGSVTAATMSQPKHGDTDFLALGLRVSTDPDELGLLLDIAVGTRRMRAVWSDGTELQMTEAPFETRLGLGADVRLGRHWSLAPMIALGLGSFGKAEWVYPNHTVKSAMGPNDVALTHGWVGLQMAAHADILGTR